MTFGDPMAHQMSGVPVRSGGGWKWLFWFAVAVLGLGFAGYVYLVPYQRIQSALSTRMGEVGAERSAAQEVGAERDKLKSQLAGYASGEKEKAAAAGKHKAELEAMTTTLKASLEPLGASLAPGDAALAISFPGPKVIDANGIDVSEGGLAALKIVGNTVKGAGARVRIKARASAAAPPRELKALFHTAGEMQAVRAARVMSALEEAGVAPESISIVGQADKAAAHARGKKAAPADHLDIEVEPE
jgi:hypothetical protein